ncbi:hypothetical protein TNCV_1359701 [Trichonephila clavipes]|nr:hypothetical protein TNCV_1359701 [Trichonephila clavipes]
MQPFEDAGKNGRYQRHDGSVRPRTTADREDKLIVRSARRIPLQLCPDDHRGRVCRSPEHLVDPAFPIARHISTQLGVIAWGTIFFTTGPFWSSLEYTYSTAVRGRHSENCFATVP